MTHSFYIAAGLVLGRRLPVVLTSRADLAEARLASMALAKIICAGNCAGPENMTSVLLPVDRHVQADIRLEKGQ